MAIGARRPAGHEGEGGAGRRLGREHGAVVDREQSPVEEFTQFHAAAGVGAAAQAGRDLQPTRAEPDGVVAGDRHRVATAEDAVKISWGPTPDGAWVGGRVREAPVEVGDELRQEALGGLAGGGPRRRSSLVRRSCSVAQSRSMRPLACGEWAAM